MQKNSAIQVPWFPKTQEDLNFVGKVLLDVKDEVNNDHLQFSDPEYRERRNFIANVAKEYRMGDTIPEIPYSKQ